ncbi:MAG: hypothetical protein DWQ49_09795 [Bacteroidetes bacterium]|nr:MAG: hypothetical protein DWQ49_09795 [Bacteroidota bacterium]
MSDKETKEPMVKVNRDRYQTTRTAAGTKSLHSGDETANILDGLTIDELFKIGDKFLEVKDDLRAKYQKLNVGMQRMNMGNRIRAKVRAIDAANAKAVEKAKKDGQPVPQVKSGIDQLIAVSAPFVDARNKRHEAEEKAKAERKAKAEEAKKAKAAKVAAKDKAKDTPKPKSKTAA